MQLWPCYKIIWVAKTKRITVDEKQNLKIKVKLYTISSEIDCQIVCQHDAAANIDIEYVEKSL